MNTTLPPDGSLWKEQARPEVYWIRDGDRLHIPNPYVLEALGLDSSAVQEVPQGGLDHIPLDPSWAPLGDATPGSVIHVPQDVGFAWNAGKVYWPLPVATTKRLVAWGQEVRTVELRGWIVGGGGPNMDDPDFSYHLEVDAGWTLERGIDLSELVKVGNILQLPAEQETGTVDGRAYCSQPVIKMEIVGFPPKGQRDRKQPPDWAFVDPDLKLKDTSAGDAFDKPVTWPFDPTTPAIGNIRIGDGDYVRVYGSLVTDKRHSGGFKEPSVNDAVELWKAGLGNNENDDARWTEIHPPDWIEVLPAPRAQTLRGVVVAAPGTYQWRGRIESVLDVDIPAPAKPAPDSVLHFREIVGPETDLGTIIEGNSALTGADITQTANPDGIRVHVKVAGRRSFVGGSPGKFRALYWLSWDAPGPAPPGPPLGAGPHRVSCMTKRRIGRLTAIATIGGVNDDGSRWVLSREAAIAAIEAGTRFYAETDGRHTDVVVARRFGRRYVKTKGDSVRRNNLLRLPRCP